MERKRKTKGRRVESSCESEHVERKRKLKSRRDDSSSDSYQVKLKRKKKTKNRVKIVVSNLSLKIRIVGGIRNQVAMTILENLAHKRKLWNQ